jgi:archaetidylinositol phosphate synthase
MRCYIGGPSTAKFPEISDSQACRPMPSERDRSLSRLNDGWLSPLERRAIAWLAPRMPGWLSPDRLTALGFAGVVVAFGGYALTPGHPAWLWLVNAGLVINWFGDSLDGAVARLRGIERPRYGFFLDQSTDVAGQFLFAMGLGISGYMPLEIAATGLAVYLMMSVQGLLRAEVSRVFHLATGGIGLTEVRCQFFALNAMFYFLPPSPFQLAGTSTTYAELLGLAWIVATLSLYLTTMIAESRRLAREEPSRPRSS